MFNIFKKQFEYGSQTVEIETGLMARQADVSVTVRIDDTVVLATVVGSEKAATGQSFFPLTVDYVEKVYAAGRIPGGFFKREGRASEKETLTSRLIDRAIRPLFPEDFLNEIQVVATVLSVNPEVDPDVVAMIAVSSALSLSGIPFLGPIGSARVGLVDGEFVLNPTKSQMAVSGLDLVVAGTQDAVLMVEAEASELSEDQMLAAISFGHEQQQTVIEAILDLVEEAGRPEWDWAPVERNVTLRERVSELARVALEKAYHIRVKKDRTLALKSIADDVMTVLCVDDLVSESDITNALSELEAEIVRGRILSGQPRIDGRDTRSVRPLDVRVSLLPRVHGSALFTRGETQSLAVTTLGTESDAQIVDSLQGESRDRFMLHYNMPPYATGEFGRMGAPKRREIGHGRLARRALAAVLPEHKDFPYTIRVVSEIMESNGSSSMASVCAGCLSLLDAGVPLKGYVAGIAMGLIKEGNRFSVLTDILGDEDHLGDMDFKVAGTDVGVTALQMDMKITGISVDVMKVALLQAKEGRLHILKTMKEALKDVPVELSSLAPRMLQMQINPDKISVVIGKGGATIKQLTEETGATVDIHETGLLTIASANKDSLEAARDRILALTAELEVGCVYKGHVRRVLDFGVIVDILAGRDGLLHVSKITKAKTQSIKELFTEGQEISVRVMGVDEKGRPRLVLAEQSESPEQVD